MRPCDAAASRVLVSLDSETAAAPLALVLLLANVSLQNSVRSSRRLVTADMVAIR